MKYLVPVLMATFLFYGLAFAEEEGGIRVVAGKHNDYLVKPYSEKVFVLRTTATGQSYFIQVPVISLLGDSEENMIKKILDGSI